MSEEPKSLIQQACDLAIEGITRRLARSIEYTTPAQGERIEIPSVSEQKSNPRDTQFAGSAAQLWAHIQEHIDWIMQGAEQEEIERVIAQYAYDLACHTIDEALGVTGSFKGYIEYIPDMPTSPEGKK